MKSDIHVCLRPLFVTEANPKQPSSFKCFEWTWQPTKSGGPMPVQRAMSPHPIFTVDDTSDGNCPVRYKLP